MNYVQKLFLFLTFVFGIVVSNSATAQEPEFGPVGTSLSNSVGLNQNVIVVMCEYLGDETPFMRADPATPGVQIEVENAEDLVELMEGPINTYYLAATLQPAAGQGITSFQFIPVPGKCQFDFVNNGLVDDPTTMEREFAQGASFADEALPGVFDSSSRIMVVVNGNKRARASWASWPLVLPNSGLTMLRAAVVGLDEVAETDFSTVAHELGHQLGLPDLYKIDGEAGRRIGQWGEMGLDRMQHFSAYSRFTANWIEDPSNRVVTITPSTVPTGLIRLDIPGNTNGNPELIRLDASSMEASPIPGLVGDVIGAHAPFIGYYVEFRNPASTPLDAPISANNYNAGMLVFRHTDWLNSETGYSPRPLTLMHPTQTPLISTPSTAAFQLGSPFVDPAMGLTITPISPNTDGSINVTVIWAPPPRPDIVAFDLRLDSPVNGLGVFVAPTLFGDPVMSTTTLTMTSVPPSVSLVIPPHSMRISLGNLGSGANPAGMTGELWLLEALIPVPFDLTNPASLIPFRTASIPFTVPVMPSGGTSTVTTTITPADSFLAVVIIHENAAETDLQMLNNVYFEPFFAVPLLSFASPYPPLSIDHEIANIDERDHMIAVSINLPKPLPEGWALGTMKNERMMLESHTSNKFHLTMIPPSPDVMKPGQLGTLATTIWMDEGDSFVPVMDIPRHFMLTASTAISLKVEGADTKFQFYGTLAQISDGAVVEGLSGQRINLTVSRAGGSDITLAGTTEPSGEYHIPFNVEEIGEVHGAIAQFPSTPHFAEAISDPVVFFEPIAPVAMIASFDAVWRANRLFLVVKLSGPASENTVLKIKSSDTRMAKAPAIIIAAGKLSGRTEVDFSTRGRRTTPLIFATSLNGRTIKTTVAITRPGAFSKLLRNR